MVESSNNPLLGKDGETETLLDAEQLGELVGLTARRIRQLATEGLPKTSRGRYPAISAVRWYCEKLRGGGDTDNVVLLQEARRRKVAAEATQAELELERAAAAVVAVAVVEQMVGELIANFRAKALAIPSKAAPQVAIEKTPGKCRLVLDRLVNECLLELAYPNVDPRGGAKRSGRRDQAPTAEGGAAAVADGKPVGRRASKAKPGKQRRAG